MRNTTVVAPPKTPEEGYRLSEDLADDAIAWLRSHKAFKPISRSSCIGPVAVYTGRTTL